MNYNGLPGSLLRAASCPCEEIRDQSHTAPHSTTRNAVRARYIYISGLVGRKSPGAQENNIRVMSPGAGQFRKGGSVHASCRYRHNPMFIDFVSLVVGLVFS